MEKKYWAIATLPFCSEKGFFENHEQIGAWVQELLQVSRKRHEVDESIKPIEEREPYPTLDFEEIWAKHLHVINIENAQASLISCFKESALTEKFNKKLANTRN